MDDRAVALRSRQALQEVRQHRGPGYTRQARSERVGGRRDAEHRHHLRALLAIALIGGIPDALVVLQRRDEGADVVPGDALGAIVVAEALQRVRQHLIARRPVEKTDRRHAGERAACHLHGREVGGEQDHAAAARHGGPQMLGALDAHHLRKPRRGEPPGERNFQQRDPEALEVPIEQSLARLRGQFGKAQLEVASRGSDETDRQAAQHRAQRAADRHHQRERQQRRYT